MKLNQLLAAAAFAASSIFSVAHAAPIVILTVGQSVPENTVTATVSGGVTTITAADIPVTITQIDAPLATPISAFFSYNAASTGNATVQSGAVFQLFNGDFTITSALGGTGTNFLSAEFANNLVSGFIGGTGLTLLATEPPGTVNFTSDIIATLGDPSTAGLTLSAVAPAVNVVPGTGTGVTIGGFTAAFAGTNSATAVPEPGTIALLGLAALGLAFSRRSKARQDKKASFEPSFA
jgi:hypothetical protein